MDGGISMDGKWWEYDAKMTKFIVLTSPAHIHNIICKIENHSFWHRITKKKLKVWKKNIY